MDIQNLTLGEIATVERLSGRAFADISDESLPKGELLSALAFVIKKRADQSFTYEQAQQLTMSDIELLLAGDAEAKKE
jgi:hypothetical protein